MIDVLLPFYGDPGLMQLAVRSVLDQRNPDWRLIVVDDGYPDDSIAPWFESLDDPRIEYHRNDRNLGANRNYTKALGLASADYVVVMGADDVMLPDYIDVMTEAIDAFPGAGIIECGVDVIGETGAVTLPLADRVKRGLTPRGDAAVELSGDTALRLVLLGNWTYFPSLCWHRETITAIGFRPQFHVVQDMALIVDVLRAGRSLVYDPRVAFQYRRHAASDSAVKTIEGARFAEERDYFATIARELRADGSLRAARAARLHLTSRLHAASLVPKGFRAGNVAATRSLLRHALAS